MKLRFTLFALLMLTAASALVAAEEAAPTLEATYLGLSSGPLRSARLVDLPEGTLLRANGVIVTETQLAARIAEAGDDAPLRRLLEKNSPYLVEKMATEALLFGEATAWAQRNAMPTGQESRATLIDAYLRSVGAQAKVTAEETKAYYEANQDMFGGAKYEQVAEDLRKYLLSDQQEALSAAHVNSLSERTPVEFSAAWLQVKAPAQLDTTVDKARRSGKPSLIDFGAGGCIPCDRMTPILEELGKTYQDQCNVMFVSVREDPVIGNRYGIRSIPAQVLFDAQGREVYRHVGFWAREMIVAKCKSLGLLP
jgi:thiol-disulfide isomerase/thioredoxin